MSVRTRLLVSIGTLLLLVIGAAILSAYHEVTSAADTVARERLQSLTKQFANMTQQSSNTGLNRTFAVANDPAVRSFLQTPSPAARNTVIKLLEQFASAQDLNNVQVELWTSERGMILAIPENGSPISANLAYEFQHADHDPFRTAGPLRPVRGNAMANFTAAVLNEQGKPVAFLVRWRKVSLSNNPEQLKKLLGNDAAIYFGNAANDVWTNSIKMFPNPPPRTNGELSEYNRDGQRVFGLEQSIEGTPWAVAIEISNQAFANQSRSFLRRMALIGFLILATGLAVAFVISGSITRPLQSLKKVADDIGRGDYSRKIGFRRHDELGALADTFNIMVEKLRTSQGELRLKSAALESAANGIVITDHTGKIVWVNRAFTVSSGYALEEVIGENPRFLKSGEQGESFYREMWETISGGKIWQDVIINRRKDGSLIHEEMTITPIQNGSGAITHFIAIKQDISERLRDRAALYETNEALTTFIKASPLTIVALDLDRKVRLWNPAAERLFGWTEAEAIGNTLPTIPSEDLPRQLELRQQFLAKGLPISDFESRRIRKDGSLVDVSVSFAPLHDAEGNINGTMGIIADISERKQAEKARLKAAEEYKLLFEGNPEPMWVFDRDTLEFIAVNEAAIHHYGFSREEFLSMTIKDIRPPEELEKLTGALRNPQLGLGRSGIWKHRKKGGAIIDVEISSSGMDFEGRPAELVLAKDVTEKLRAQEALRLKNEEVASMTQQLWQASKLATMGELAASIAHELNNPLATVGLRAENLLLQVAADDAQHHPLEVILDEVERMAKLVNNLLQFSRRTHRQVSTVDVCEEIGNSIEFIQYHLRSHKIEIDLDFAESLPTIQADRQQLRQLFLNLLTNASDAMPNGGRITIRAKPTFLAGAAAVQIDFTDSGEGISPENLAKIWEPFFTTKKEGKGTGLGLGICRRIVEEHGGTIDIHSQFGRNTTVETTFPATTDDRIEGY